MNFSSISEVRNAHGTSTIATSRLSDASRVVVINIDPVGTVGNVAYDLLDVFCCLWLSAHMQPFTFQHQLF